LTNNTTGHLKIKAQIMCAGEIALGPGKADLLANIDTYGSISAAARALGLSYRRAWLMVDTMNRCWVMPLVEATKGGRTGAKLTQFGKEILLNYRYLQREIDNLHSSEAALSLACAITTNKNIIGCEPS
jgi:molybdate transport system regulatory protein